MQTVVQCAVDGFVHGVRFRITKALAPKAIQDFLTSGL
jgi:hypothetical protein